jgi:hypothetical protein
MHHVLADLTAPAPGIEVALLPPVVSAAHRVPGGAIKVDRPRTGETEAGHHRTGGSRVGGKTVWDNKGGDSKVSDSKVSDNKVSDNKVSDNKASDNKAAYLSTRLVPAFWRPSEACWAAKACPASETSNSGIRAPKQRLIATSPVNRLPKASFLASQPTALRRSRRIHRFNMRHFSRNAPYFDPVEFR